jgi:hypothetical protein
MARGWGGGGYLEEPLAIHVCVCTFMVYGSEILSLTMKEGYTLHVLEIKVLRQICGPKRGEVIR